MGDLSDIKYQYGMCGHVFLPHFTLVLAIFLT